VLLARILSSWFPPPITGPMRTVWELLHDVTEPILAPVRRMMPPVQAGGMGLDFSPIVVFVILGVLQSVICF
jgi:YggT family protein